ncbi:MAG TPA: hypothetical protein VHY08_14450, partial [Bacillota bacterium]|nr:hypothetical protein [Bacillota bacterium]
MEPITLVDYYPEAPESLQSKIVTLLAANLDSWRKGLIPPFGANFFGGSSEVGINETNMSYAA